MASKETATKYRGSELMKAASGVQRDVLNVVLSPDRLYSADEATALSNQFLNKEVASDGRR